MAKYRVIKSGHRAEEIQAVEATVGNSGTLEFYDVAGGLVRAYAVGTWIEIEERK